jgi:hypothetical protein
MQCCDSPERVEDKPARVDRHAETIGSFEAQIAVDGVGHKRRDDRHYDATERKACNAAAEDKLSQPGEQHDVGDRNSERVDGLERRRRMGSEDRPQQKEAGQDRRGNDDDEAVEDVSESRPAPAARKRQEACDEEGIAQKEC